ncbi:MAG: sulfite exporter TauE/SafE family protein [Fidelibacterota bacterium]|jgi:uncharacterized membrane protein YfcA|tara:strand:- start:1697 stop:2533 length:837 start_codon:yes stop_codon:yes gene_type:complete
MFYSSWRYIGNSKNYISQINSSINQIFEFHTLLNLEIFQWLQIIFCAIGIGMAKTGLGGIGLLVVPVMASLFGAKASTGVLLIILIIADIFGVTYYHQHADIKKLLKLIPSTIIGILIGVTVGNNVDENQFKIFLASIVIIGILLMFVKKPEVKNQDNQSFLLTSFVGILGGVSTMVGNAAGPVMTVYFLSMGFQKNKFIGTAAWFFLVVNLFKVPFHIFSWETINFSILYFGLSLVPFIVLGALSGVWVVKKIPEKPYRLILIGSVLLSVLKLVFIF